MNPITTIDHLLARGSLDAAELGWLVGSGARARYHRWRDASRGTAWFDLASLSKPLTATLAVQLDASGDLPLRTKLASIWERELPTWLRDTALEDLLRHRARLQAWRPLYAEQASWDETLLPLLAVKRVGRVARKGTYSDLSYMLWALLAERCTGTSLWQLLDEHVLGPLGLKGQFCPAELVGRGGSAIVVEPCTLSTQREVELAAGWGQRVDDLGPPERGEVQDGNARWFGRYCGHAGLFGTCEGLLRFADHWRVAVCAPEAAEPRLSQTRARDALRGTGTRRLGWWRRTLRGAGGPALSGAAFGHTGFVGGSLWIDPCLGISVCLLTHRSSAACDLQPLRRACHRWVVTAANRSS